MTLLQTNRYESLDVLRGLCALSIMVYHYCTWVFGALNAENVLGRFGIYGVSLFYILSGLTMFLVYFEKFSFSLSFCKDFYLKRFFRIFPLMWFVLVVAYLLFGTTNSFWQQLEIASGLFSISNWSASTPLGMWSIGNELSFYLMLPFVFLAFKKGKVFGLVVTLLLLLFYVYFAYYGYNPIEEDDFEVRNYKNPLNQAFLFVGGILIGYVFKNIDVKPKHAFVVSTIALLLFFFLPAYGPKRVLYIGNYRLIFTAISFLIAFGFFKMNLGGINLKLKKALLWLGEISYSLYLLHGMVWAVIVLTGMKIRFVFPCSFIATLLVSHLVYKYFEAPARNLGYSILKKK